MTETEPQSRSLDQIAAGDVLMGTRLGRSTRDLLNTQAAITERKPGFRSLADAWADATTAHGRLMLTVLGGLAEFESEPIRARTGVCFGVRDRCSAQPWGSSCILCSADW